VVRFLLRPALGAGYPTDRWPRCRKETIRLAQDRYADRVELRLHDFAEPLDLLNGGPSDAAIRGLMIQCLRDSVPPPRKIRHVPRPSRHLILSSRYPAADWLRKGASCFATRLETDVWQVEDRDDEARSSRLGAIRSGISRV